MKVDPRLTSDLNSTIDATRLSDRIDNTTRTSAQNPTQTISDQVSLSPDVALANAAAQAATNASDIRPSEVVRAKALLQNGQVGTDLNSLASKIIDSLLS